MNRRKVLVMDGNDGPCIRSLFGALARIGWDVYLFRPYALSYYSGILKMPLRAAYTWRSIGQGIHEQFIPVPGFSRFERLSLAIIRWRRAKTEEVVGKFDAVVYTMPYYAKLVRDDKTPRIYFAYDAYRFYSGWNQKRVESQETTIVSEADAVCVVSRQLMEDWNGKTRGLLVYAPNATSDEFVRASCAGLPDKPSDLKRIAGPIVGCVGNISSSGYDWSLIRALAHDFINTAFVFLGQVVEESDQMDQVRQLPNVHFLGAKPHNELPGYVTSFDVCFNPLALNDLNHRRCPLRLYDYLTTDKPILSTPVREALEFGKLIAICKDFEECRGLLAMMFAGKYIVDMQARREFIAKQTWENRAAQLSAVLEGILEKGA
jgi:glycosyltransferase involved in cell wall biosynthesis